MSLRFVQASGAVGGELPLPNGRVGIGEVVALVEGVEGLKLPTLPEGAVQVVDGGTLLDVYGYGTLSAVVDMVMGLAMFETTTGPTQAPGEAAGRYPDGHDTDDNAADFTVVTGGSPGALNGPGEP